MPNSPKRRRKVQTTQELRIWTRKGSYCLPPPISEAAGTTTTLVDRETVPALKTIRLELTTSFLLLAFRATPPSPTIFSRDHTNANDLLLLSSVPSTTSSSDSTTPCSD